MFEELMQYYIYIVIIAMIGFVIFKSLIIIRQQECLVIERLGKFSSILPSGLHFLIPFIDKPRSILWSRNGSLANVDRIDLREVFLDIPEQRVITKDNVGIVVDAIIYVQIFNVQRAVYEIQALPIALAQLTQTTLRSLIGEMDLDSTLSGRDLINTRLKGVLDEAAEKWGIKVKRVEIKNVTPPPDVQAAMEKQMQAERERRANVLSAEGAKQSQILVAEGDKKSRIERSEGEMQERINQAQGERQAFIAIGEGQAQAIELVAQAQSKSISMMMQAFQSPDAAAQYLITMEYLKQYGEMTKKPTDKMFIPYEAAGTLGALSSIKEIFSGSTGHSHPTKKS